MMNKQQQLFQSYKCKQNALSDMPIISNNIWGQTVN